MIRFCKTASKKDKKSMKNKIDMRDRRSMKDIKSSKREYKGMIIRGRVNLGKVSISIGRIRKKGTTII